MGFFRAPFHRSRAHAHTHTDRTHRDKRVSRACALSSLHDRVTPSSVAPMLRVRTYVRKYVYTDDDRPSESTFARIPTYYSRDEIRHESLSSSSSPPLPSPDSSVSRPPCASRTESKLSVVAGSGEGARRRTRFRSFGGCDSRNSRVVVPFKTHRDIYVDIDEEEGTGISKRSFPRDGIFFSPTLLRFFPSILLQFQILRGSRDSTIRISQKIFPRGFVVPCLERATWLTVVGERRYRAEKKRNVAAISFA